MFFTILALFAPFWTFLDENQFFASKTQIASRPKCSKQKIKFYLGLGTGGIFYRCLWVTQLCAKFGRSRISRTANATNSFIVLLCMWKEPAPFNKHYNSFGTSPVRPCFLGLVRDLNVVLHVFSTMLHHKDTVPDVTFSPFIPSIDGLNHKHSFSRPPISLYMSQTALCIERSPLLLL